VASLTPNAIRANANQHTFSDTLNPAQAPKITASSLLQLFLGPKYIDCHSAFFIMANENSWKYQFTNDTNHQRFPKDFKSSSSSTRRESYESMENGTHKMAHSHHASLNVNESSFTILTQVIGPLLIAGLGMVLAGLLLDHIQVSHFSLDFV